MQRSRPSISQSRRRRVFWRVFEVKYYEYILFRRVPELQPEGGCMRSPGRRSPPRAPKHTLTGEMPHQLRWEWHALIGWGGF